MPWPDFSYIIDRVVARATRAREDAAEPVVPPPDPEEVAVPEALEETPTPVEPLGEVQRLNVGVWVGRSSFKDPSRDVGFCVEHNINQLHIIVNDHSAWREPRDFDVWNAKQISALATAAADAGMDVHLMSWIMPHEVYLRQAANVLVALAQRTGAKSVQWDAEEPWMKARKPMPRKEAAELLVDEFSAAGVSMGVNGIGYASKDKLGPLAAVCDYTVPQVYATAKSGLDPKKAPRQFYDRWHKSFSKPVMMGLAAYRQQGMPGYGSPGEAMLASIEAVRQIPQVDTVVYWSLRHIRANKQVAKAIASIRGSDKVA